MRIYEKLIVAIGVLGVSTFCFGDDAVFMYEFNTQDGEKIFEKHENFADDIGVLVSALDVLYTENDTNILFLALKKAQERAAQQSEENREEVFRDIFQGFIAKKLNEKLKEVLNVLPEIQRKSFSEKLLIAINRLIKDEVENKCDKRYQNLSKSQLKNLLSRIKDIVNQQLEKLKKSMNKDQPETWWQEAESNRRHKDFQSSALPTELSRQNNTELSQG